MEKRENSFEKEALKDFDELTKEVEKEATPNMVKGYEDIIELINYHTESDFDLLTPEETLEKVIELCEFQLEGGV